MTGKDAVAEALGELGVSATPTPGAAVDALLRRDPASAKRLVGALAPRLARLPRAEAGETLLALGSALLVAGDAPLAREHLVEAAALLAATPELAARAELRLAASELALGKIGAGRAHVERAFAGAIASRDAGLVTELSRVLESAGESVAARAVALLGRAARRGEDARGAQLARVLGTLNSCAAGTAEPLFEILRAVIEETAADRGFLMLYRGAVLQLELGLSRQGRRLGREDFACSETVVERALEAGGPVLVPDLAATLPLALASSAQALGLRSALCVPLRVERRRSGAPNAAPGLPHVKGVAGVLYVDSRSTGSFDDADVPFFAALGDAAVLALKAAGGRPAAPPEPPVAEEPFAFAGLETRAAGMARALRTLERVAATDAALVLVGESGSGKERFARALHASGRRASRPFVAVDCGALPESLAVHELFGHEEGAYTGAGPARPGLVEQASGGTLFLDAVDELPAQVQAALLRVLQEGEVRRVGGDRMRPVDVRLVSSTTKELAALVERGVLRNDLLYRLAVVEVRIPPLRERLEDLAVLVPRLLGDGLALGPGALERLEEHAWPGNVRELENVLRAAALQAKKGVVDLAAVESVLGPAPAAAPAPARSGTLVLGGTIEEIERRAILERLESLDWNQVKAAESLGLDRTTLRRKLTRYGIARPRG